MSTPTPDQPHYTAPATFSQYCGIAEILPECAILLAMAAVMFSVAVQKFKWD